MTISVPLRTDKNKINKQQQHAREALLVIPQLLATPQARATWRHRSSPIVTDRHRSSPIVADRRRSSPIVTDRHRSSPIVTEPSSIVTASSPIVATSSSLWLLLMCCCVCFAVLCSCAMACIIVTALVSTFCCGCVCVICIYVDSPSCDIQCVWCHLATFRCECVCCCGSVCGCYTIIISFLCVGCMCANVALYIVAWLSCSSNICDVVVITGVMLLLLSTLVCYCCCGCCCTWCCRCDYICCG